MYGIYGSPISRVWEGIGCPDRDLAVGHGTRINHVSLGLVHLFIFGSTPPRSSDPQPGHFSALSPIPTFHRNRPFNTLPPKGSTATWTSGSVRLGPTRSAPTSTVSNHRAWAPSMCLRISSAVKGTCPVGWRWATGRTSTALAPRSERVPGRPSVGSVRTSPLPVQQRLNDPN